MDIRLILLVHCIDLATVLFPFLYRPMFYYIANLLSHQRHSLEMQSSYTFLHQKPLSFALPPSFALSPSFPLSPSFAHHSTARGTLSASYFCHMHCLEVSVTKTTKLRMLRSLQESISSF